MPTVLAIDDDRSVLHMVSSAFKDTEVRVLTASNASEGERLVQQQRPDVVLLDIMLPEISGLDAFQRIHRIDTKLPVVFVTAGGRSETAIEAMMLGAYDYVVKPIDVAKLRQIVEQALETRRLMHVPVAIPAASDYPDTDGDILVGRSPRMLDVYKAVGRVASQNVTVLIHGESGTGKELVARAIYQHSPRAGGPFLAVNCAALTDTLLESELFGHEKGSFTGADSRRIGKFEQCHGGTIFLDEVGDMSPLLQSKVLRLLQEQKFERVGGNTTIQTDVRIITATNRDLEKMAGDGEFREDLYYRLNGFKIDLPPLRERGNDIPLLIEHFLARYSRQMHKPIEGISTDALQILMRYGWPGNVRQLQATVRQALVNATGPVIVPSDLPPTVLTDRPARGEETGGGDDQLPPSDLRRLVDERLAANTNDLYAEALEMMEQYTVTRVLRLTEGNQSKAAQILGITRGSLRNKIRSLGISIDQVVSVDEADEEE